MNQIRVLSIVALWYLKNVASASYADEWSDWIIIPARSANRDYNKNNSRNITSYDVRGVNSVNTYVDPSQVNTFILRTVKLNDGRNQQPQKLSTVDSSQKSSNDVIVPIGRTIEKVRDFCEYVMDFFHEMYSFPSDNEARGSTDSNRKLKKFKKKYRKFLFPLLVAYKLKFLALIPMLIGGLVLLVGTTGLAGFFFALFTAVMSLKTDNKYEIKKW